MAGNDSGPEVSMRRFHRHVPLLVIVVCAVPLLAQDSARLPLDRSAIYVTHMPHRDAFTRGNRISGAPLMEGPAVTPAFNSSQYIVGPTVAPTTTVPEAEEEIAISPQNSQIILSAISDFAAGFNTTKYAFSSNNGASWTESYVPVDPSTGFLATGDGFFWLANSDPTVAIDKSGNAYLADLYLDAIDNGNGFYVSVANANTGFKFTVANTHPVKTNPSSSTTQLEDKPWLTVDTSSALTSGYVYVSWSHFYNSTMDFIAFSRSTNHGKTWSAPRRISPKTQDGAVQGSSVAVGPKGEIYVVYEVFFAGNNRQQFMAKSTNGGGTFSAPAAKTPMFTDLTFNSSYRKNSFANLAVNPVNGNVYMTYADQPGANSQVEFLVSTNGGLTFSAPAVINDDASGQRFFTALAVDSTGVIHASWFDTRNSPSDASMYDVYATFSKDGGATFSNNARVTVGLANAGTTSFIGDYSGLAAAGGYAHPVWTNGGGNNGQLQTSALQLP